MIRFPVDGCFNTQPPEGGWAGFPRFVRPSCKGFQHTAARRRLATKHRRRLSSCKFQHTAARRRLDINQALRQAINCFNTQPPEGGWGKDAVIYPPLLVSTHSRPKAAGPAPCSRLVAARVSTHSRPKAAGGGN